MGWSVEKKKGNLPRRRPDDPFERIYAHYHDLTVEIVLTDTEKQRLDIYEFAYDQYVKGFSRGAVSKSIIVEFEKKGIEIARRTAFQYLRDAIDLFGDIEEIDLSREKRIFIEICKTGLERADELNDMKSYSAILQTLNKVYDFNQNSDELSEYLKKMKPFAIIISSDASVLEKQAQELVQDIDHEEMSEDGNQET